MYSYAAYAPQTLFYNSMKIFLEGRVDHQTAEYLEKNYVKTIWESAHTKIGNLPVETAFVFCSCCARTDEQFRYISILDETRK